MVCGHGKIIAEGTAPITCDGFLDDDYQVSGYGLSVSDLTLNGGQNTLATRMYFQRMNLTITDVQTDKPVTIRWDENYAIDAKDTNTKTIKDELTKYIKCTANNKPCKAEIIYSGDTNDTSEEYSGSFVVNK